MKIRNLFIFSVTFTAILAISGVASVALTIEYTDIGSGDLCYSFAIFADPQVGEGGGDIGQLTAAVDEIITRNNNAPTDDDIRFVIVLGDLIQGEKDNAGNWKGEGANIDLTSYRGEYYAVQQELERLKSGAGIPYIPMTGNHDVWFNYNDYSTTGGYPDYPEHLFAETDANDGYFGSQYKELETELPNWEKQEGMPIGNPYDDSISETFPDIYFQNFAFDCGPYHFICLDFCARDDFVPEYIEDVPLWGYADLHDKKPDNSIFNEGTWKWFLDHLASGVASGQISTENTIIFSHHPPDTDQRPFELDFLPKAWYGFSDDDDSTLISTLTPYRNKIAYWFGGHRHGYNYDVMQCNPTNCQGTETGWYSYENLKDLGFPVICPYFTVPSVMNLPHRVETDLPPPFTFDMVTYPGNDNGWLQIVKVKHPTGGANLPDPFISTIVGQNPDVVLYEPVPPTSHDYTSDSEFTYSADLDPNKDYQIRVKLHNGGCIDANINVEFYWAGFGIGWGPTNWKDDAFTSSDGVNANPSNPNGIYTPLNEICGITIPPGEEKKVYILLDSAIIQGEAVEPHGCIYVVIKPLNGDIRPDPYNNNMATENIDVNPTKGAESADTIHIPIPVYNPTNISDGVILEVTPTEGRLWNATVYPPHLLFPHHWGTAYLVLHPVQDLNVGDVENFRVIGRRADNGELIGGVEIASLIDDPPILEWAGNNGYASDGVEPDEGNAGTTFIFRVKYKDENNHAPARGYPILYLFKGDKQIQGSPFVMNEEASTEVYTDGKNYTYSIALLEPGADYTYYFWARDSLGIAAEGPATNVMSGPKILPEKINETMYKDSITQPIDVSRIRFVHNAVNEKWVKGSKWPITMELMYWQKSTKYLIEIDIEGNGNVTRVGFRRWGNPITEIPYKLAEQSLASLPPGFAIGP